jgi:sulfhydrogenase subunit beta (sulfur reductase)
MKQTIRVISKKDLLTFVNALIHDGTYDVVGAKARRERFGFDTLTNAGELRLDHDVTIIPPKKYFLPQYEHLMKYSLEKPFQVQPIKE